MEGPVTGSRPIVEEDLQLSRVISDRICPVLETADLYILGGEGYETRLGDTDYVGEVPSDTVNDGQGSLRTTEDVVEPVVTQSEVEDIGGSYGEFGLVLDPDFASSAQWSPELLDLYALGSIPLVVAFYGYVSE